jgi:hypothetical protein
VGKGCEVAQSGKTVVEERRREAALTGMLAPAYRFFAKNASTKWGETSFFMGKTLSTT